MRHGRKTVQRPCCVSPARNSPLDPVVFPGRGRDSVRVRVNDCGIAQVHMSLVARHHVQMLMRFGYKPEQKGETGQGREEMAQHS